MEKGILPVVTRGVAVTPIDQKGKGKGKDVAAPRGDGKGVRWDDPGARRAGQSQRKPQRERIAAEARAGDGVERERERRAN